MVYLCGTICFVSSAGLECLLHTQEVRGSNPRRNTERGLGPFPNLSLCFVVSPNARTWGPTANMLWRGCFEVFGFV